MSSVPVSFWNTIEVDCIARSFSYEDYVNLHEKSGCPAAILCPAAYTLMEKVFETQFMYDNDMEETLDELRN